VRLVVREPGTPLGPARVHVARPPGPLAGANGTLLLGHGAGGGIGASDLQAVARRALADGWVVGLVEQPWRVAGKKVAVPPPKLDVGWTAVVESLASGRSRLPRPFVFGGRSAGARVACRLAGPLGAVAVVALAFPLHPPGKPDSSRLFELAGAVAGSAGGPAGVPALVVQGERDPFGSAEELTAALSALPRAELSATARRRVHVAAVPGDHGLKGSAGAAADAVQTFLAGL
jgi:predicted alpha/beta-hydrolase family hydrolase